MDPSAQAVEELVAAGFDREKADFAMKYFEGNLQKATEYLLQSDGLFIVQVFGFVTESSFFN